jgi:hypothetical protein
MAVFVCAARGRERGEQSEHGDECDMSKGRLGAAEQGDGWTGRVARWRARDSHARWTRDQAPNTWCALKGSVWDTNWAGYGPSLDMGQKAKSKPTQGSTNVIKAPGSLGP